MDHLTNLLFNWYSAGLLSAAFALVFLQYLLFSPKQEDGRREPFDVQYAFTGAVAVIASLVEAGIEIPQFPVGVTSGSLFLLGAKSGFAWWLGTRIIQKLANQSPNGTAKTLIIGGAMIAALATALRRR